jgi:hypothetical protein
VSLGQEQLMQRNGLIYLGLTALTLLCLGHVCANAFVHFDDHLYVYANFLVQQGLSWHTFQWAWTTLYLGIWQPLVWLSFQLDASMFGPARPDADKVLWFQAAWGFHLVNLLWHAANVLLLYRLLHRWTAAQGKSALVAALFAVHPLHVESVAWVTERKDMLSGFFLLLTLLTYSSYCAHRSPGRYVLALFCFFLGLASKPILVTLPCVLLLWDFWPLGRLSWGQPVPGPLQQNQVPPVSLRWALLEKVPFLLLSALVSWTTWQAHAQDAAIFHFPLESRLVSALLNYGWYLWKTFWPTELAPIYPLRTGEFFSWQMFLALGLLVGITGLVGWQWRRRPYALVGWLWFVGMLVPVSGIVQAGSANFADRFTYLPHIGLFIMLVWSGEEILTRSHLAPRLQIGLAGVVLVALAVLTWRQVALWKDTQTLILHTLRVTDKNFMAYRILAGYYLDFERWEEGIRYSHEGLTVARDDSFFHLYLANGYSRLGNKTEGMKHAKLAEELTDRPSYLNLGLVYFNMKEYPEAIRLCRKHVEKKPGDFQAYYVLGRSYYALDQFRLAKEHFETCLSLNPHHSEAQGYLKQINFKLGL